MDTTPPTSTVNPLPRADDIHELHRLGDQPSDPTGANGSTASGVASIAIYDSTDGGPFILLRHRHARQSVGHRSPARPAIPTASTASRPTTPATSRRRRPRPSRPSRSSRRCPSTRSPPSRPPRGTRPSPPSTSPSASPPARAASAAAALTLTDNGGPNLITGAVTITLVSGSTYSINGLSGLTDRRGNLHPDRERRRHQGRDRQSRHRLAVHLMADGHDPAHQHGQRPARQTPRPRASRSR